jgi:hypothetical protein
MPYTLRTFASHPVLETLEDRLVPSAIVDNDQAGYYEWGIDWASDAGGFGGDYRYLGPSAESHGALWQFTGLAPGVYDVQATWFGDPSWAPDVPFYLYDGDTYLDAVLVNQQKPPAGEKVDGAVFQTLAAVSVSSGTLWVYVTNEASGWFMADAVRLTAAIPARAELAFSTFLGGSRFEHVRDVTTDSQGNIYLTGGTLSEDFPVTPGAYQTEHNPGEPDNPNINPFDVFVVKLDPQGQLVWSTFLGGRNYDRAYAIEVDSQGYVYVAGRAGAGFPVTAGAFQTQFMGGQEAAFYGPQDGFLAKLSPDGGKLLWASYFGTNDPQIIRDIALDAGGDIYLASARRSGSYPPAVAQAFQSGFQPTPRAGVDGVVAKVATDGSAVLWASYLGGDGNEGGAPSIRVDAWGSAYSVFATQSNNMPTTPGAYDRSFNGGWDLHVARWYPDGSGLFYGTYLGGSGNEDIETHNLAIDALGQAYVSSGTNSANFPTTPGAFQRTFGGVNDVFVAKLSRDGDQLLAATYVGGSAGDHAEGIAVDVNGNVTFSGISSSANFPVTADAYQPTRRGPSDLIAVKLAADFGSLAYSTYLGGGGTDYGRVGFADSLGNIYVSGETGSVDWPTLNAMQPTFGGGNADAMVAKFTPPGTRPAPGGGGFAREATLVAVPQTGRSDSADEQLDAWAVLDLGRRAGEE